MIDWPRWPKSRILIFRSYFPLYRYIVFHPSFHLFSPEFSRYAVRLVCFSRDDRPRERIQPWIGDGSVIEGCHVPSIARFLACFFSIWDFYGDRLERLFFLPWGAFHRVFINRNLKFIPVSFDSWSQRKIVCIWKKWEILNNENVFNIYVYLKEQF